jgi:hypothetical protein
MIEKTEAEQTHAAIRQFYLSLPGKNEQGWQAVAQDPSKFNFVWRRMVGQAAGDAPPEQ